MGIEKYKLDNMPIKKGEGIAEVVIKAKFYTLIVNGELKEGERIPSMRQLCKVMNVGIIPINRAIEQLKKEGILKADDDQSTIKTVYIGKITPEKTEKLRQKIQNAQSEVNKLGKKSKEKLYEKVERNILRRIIEGKLKEGDKLPTQRKLAEEMEVGIVTVTRAMSELSDMGIVSICGNKGAYLKEISDENRKMICQYLDYEDVTIKENKTSYTLIEYFKLTEGNTDANLEEFFRYMVNSPQYKKWKAVNENEKGVKG